MTVMALNTKLPDRSIPDDDRQAPDRRDDADDDTPLGGVDVDALYESERDPDPYRSL